MGAPATAVVNETNNVLMKSSASPSSRGPGSLSAEQYQTFFDAIDRTHIRGLVSVSTRTEPHKYMPSKVWIYTTRTNSSKDLECLICATMFPKDKLEDHLDSRGHTYLRKKLADECASIGVAAVYADRNLTINFLLRQLLPFELVHLSLSFAMETPPIPMFKYINRYQKQRSCGNHDWCETENGRKECCICSYFTSADPFGVDLFTGFTLPALASSYLFMDPPPSSLATVRAADAVQWWREKKMLGLYRVCYDGSKVVHGLDQFCVPCVGMVEKLCDWKAKIIQDLERGQAKLLNQHYDGAWDIEASEENERRALLKSFCSPVPE